MTHSTSAGTAIRSDVPDHRGQPREPDVELFAPPPREIGTILSADSTLRTGRGPKHIVVRILMGLAFAVVVVIAFEWMASTSGDRSERESMRTLGYVFAVVAFLSQMYATRFNATCTYVGTLGAVRSRVRGRVQAQPTTEVLLYGNVSELFAQQTRQYVNGIYSGTTYDYTWITPTGERVYRMKGSYREKKKGAKAGDLWHFACAAERAWTVH